MSWFETGFNPNFRPTRGLFQGLVTEALLHVRFIYLYMNIKECNNETGAAKERRKKKNKY